MVLRALLKVLPQYLYTYLTSPKTLTEFQILAESRSGTFPQITFQEISNYLLPLPSKPEQQKIIKFLDSINNKIKLNLKMNKTLEEIGKALFKRWFVNFEFPDKKGKPYKSSGGRMVDSELREIPEGWEIGKLKDLIKITSGKRPKIKADNKTETFRIPIIGASGIMGYTSDTLYDKKIIVTGRVGTLGKVQKIDYPCWMSDNSLVIQSEYYEYIYEILVSMDFSTLNVGSTQPLITQTTIKDLNIIIPGKLLLQKFELIMDSLTLQDRSNKKEIDRLKKIKDSLLPRLMSGRLRVN